MKISGWDSPPLAVLFDRDGTLVVDVPYNGDPALVVPMPGAREAIALVRAAGLPIGVVSNQSGIARGIVTAEQVEAVNAAVDALLGGFDVWRICPHGPDDGCDCRKPAARAGAAGGGGARGAAGADRRHRRLPHRRRCRARGRAAAACSCRRRAAPPSPGLVTAADLVGRGPDRARRRRRVSTARARGAPDLPENLGGLRSPRRDRTTDDGSAMTDETPDGATIADRHVAALLPTIDALARRVRAARALGRRCSPTASSPTAACSPAATAARRRRRST